LNRDFSKEVDQTAKKCMKNCSPSLVTKEMQIKTTLRLHFTPGRKLPSRPETTTNVSEDVGEKEALYTAGGNVS
jgi:hypothetical protein